MPGSRLADPQLRSAISSAMKRVMLEFYGARVGNVRTYIFGDYLFCVLEEPLTALERTFVEAGEHAMVRDVRIAFQDLMTRTFVGEIERLTGRTVVGYHSQVVFQPATAVEIFVLDRQRPIEMQSWAHHSGLGCVGVEGDADRLPPRSAGSDTALRRSDERASPGTAISVAVERGLARDFGNRPARTTTFVEGDYTFCVVEDPLTTVERTLVRGRRHHMVRAMRIRFWELKKAEYEGEVEHVLGRTVRTSAIQIVFDPNHLFLLFRLKPDE